LSTDHPKILFTHPTGNPNSKNAALAFKESGMLHEVVTSYFYDQSRYGWLNLLPSKISDSLQKELSRRSWPELEGIHICSQPFREMMRMIVARTGFVKFMSQGRRNLSDLRNVSLDRHIARRHLTGIRAVYGYEDAVAETFTEARKRGILCFYEIPTFYFRRNFAIRKEESILFPEFTNALRITGEAEWKIERRERELRLSDHIFAPSSAVQRSLLEAGIPKDKISVIPYGSPINYFSPRPKNDHRFRAIFVGQVGPRKGVHYLLQAWKDLRLPGAELQLVGGNEFPAKWLDRYQPFFKRVSHVPHLRLNQYYSEANVFVFPSLIEGLALVLLEAMACGVPVITTTNSGGLDIISDGVEGFIVPIRDVNALKEKLEWCYSHPKELAEMGRAARRKAEQLTWQLYRARLGARIKQLLIK